MAGDSFGFVTGFVMQGEALRGQREGKKAGGWCTRRARATKACTCTRLRTLAGKQGLLVARPLALGRKAPQVAELVFDWRTGSGLPLCSPMRRSTHAAAAAAKRFGGTWRLARSADGYGEAQPSGVIC